MVGKSEQEKRFSVNLAELLEEKKREQINQAVIGRWVGQPMGMLKFSKFCNL